LISHRQTNKQTDKQKPA